MYIWFNGHVHHLLIEPKKSFLFILMTGWITQRQNIQLAQIFFDSNHTKSETKI